MNKHSCKGFTLIELLVVIAIIAILAAILFPVFATAREKARQTTCASNLKQLGLSFAQYTNNYDESLPYDDQGNSNIKGAGWASQLYPYVKARAVFTCPDDSNAATGNNVEFSYIMNQNLIAIPNGGSSWTHYPQGGIITKLVSPALTVMLCESASPTKQSDPTVQNGNQVDYSSETIGSNSSATGGLGIPFGNLTYLDTGQLYGRTIQTVQGSSGLDYAFPTGRHTGGSNYLLCDGHVKWLRGTAVSSGQNPQPPQDATCSQDYAPCVYGKSANFLGSASSTSALGSQPGLAATFSTY